MLSGQCIFCQTNLTAPIRRADRQTDRASEHVYRRSRVEKLGHSWDELTTLQFTGAQPVSSTAKLARDTAADDICKQCNNSG